MLSPFYYADFKDKVLLTNDSGNYAFLTPNAFSSFVHEEIDTESEIWDMLQSRGFCYSDSQESFIRRNEHLVRDANSYLLSATSLFIFAITNSCNNRCIYCQANGTNECSNMGIGVAEQALLRIKDSPSRNITIEFQGGEPLINFSAIKYIVTRAADILKHKNVQFALVSNLSLIDDDIAAFLKANNVSVSTSLDGPDYLHNYNRPLSNGQGSYVKMLRGKEILLRHGITPGAIQTTTAKSLSLAHAIVDEYVNGGFHQIFLRPLTRLGAAARSWDKIGYSAEEFLVFYRSALDRIIDYNLNGYRINEYHASLFLSKILVGKAVNYMELRSPCGAGIGQMAITANGNVYTCDEGRMIAESGDEAFYLGNVFQNDYADWINSSCCQAICSASLLDTLPGCCDCVFKPYCGVCPVVNYAIHGNILHVSKERCKIYKGILQILFEYIYDGNSKIHNLFSDWGEQA